MLQPKTSKLSPKKLVKENAYLVGGKVVIICSKMQAKDLKSCSVYMIAGNLFAS